MSVANYDTKVVEKIGEKAWKRLQTAAQEGELTAEQMNQLAYGLHRSVGGGLRQRLDGRRIEDVDWWAQMRKILSHWYNEGLLDLDTQSALEKLIEILNSVDAQAIVRDLESFLPRPSLR